MGKKFYETKAFLQLRRKFYAKLASKGFKDIEITDWNTGKSGNLLHGFGHMGSVKSENGLGAGGQSLGVWN